LAPRKGACRRSYAVAISGGRLLSLHPNVTMRMIAARSKITWAILSIWSHAPELSQPPVMQARIAATTVAFRCMSVQLAACLQRRISRKAKPAHTITPVIGIQNGIRRHDAIQARASRNLNVRRKARNYHGRGPFACEMICAYIPGVSPCGLALMRMRLCFL
jgi:hypothetical protein